MILSFILQMFLSEPFVHRPYEPRILKRVLSLKVALLRANHCFFPLTQDPENVSSHTVPLGIHRARSRWLAVGVFESVNSITQLHTHARVYAHTSTCACLVAILCLFLDCFHSPSLTQQSDWQRIP